nr:hypothetical protein CFP56_56886 [Quercus suber]
MADKNLDSSASSTGRARRVSSPDSSESAWSILTCICSCWSDRADCAPGTSSKASSPAETPPARSQIDFQFLNFSHPSEAKASRALRTVRSHVTKQQHQREHAAQAARRVGVSTSSSDHLAAPPSMSHARTFPPDPSRTQPVPQPLVLPSRGSPESSSGSTSPSPTYAPTRRIDPADIYPESWHPHIPRTIVSSFLT